MVISTPEEVTRYWSSREDVPPSGIYPVGDPQPFGPGLHKRIASYVPAGKSVLDFGCGPGLMSECFPPQLYLGVDINRKAVKVAREHHPRHRFEVVGPFSKLPTADVTLAIEVLLHIHDDDLPRLGALLVESASVVMIMEIMDSVYRSGSPEGLNRDISDYDKLATSLGRRQSVLDEIPVPRLGNVGTLVEWR